MINYVYLEMQILLRPLQLVSLYQPRNYENQILIHGNSITKKEKKNRKKKNNYVLINYLPDVTKTCKIKLIIVLIKQKHYYFKIQLENILFFLHSLFTVFYFFFFSYILCIQFVKYQFYYLSLILGQHIFSFSLISDKHNQYSIMLRHNYLGTHFLDMVHQ